MPASVLYVDDDRSLCQIVAKALQSEGYSVRTCHDGDDALAIVGEHPPDLMLLDLMLPRRDGFQVLADIRASEGPEREVPVVIITGCSPTPAYAQRANELNALDLLSKPVSLEKLLEVVGRYAGHSKRAVPVRPRRETPSQRSRASGTLDRVSLPAVLHHLHGLRATGVLHLSSGKKRKWIQLRDGYPVAVRSNLVRETLGRHLLRTGRISADILEESRRAVKKGGMRQGEILVAMDVLSEEQVTAALREQADEKFFEIFAWEEGSFRFERGASLQRANAMGLGRSPANLILEGVCTRFPLGRIDRYLERQKGRFLVHGESPFYRFQDVHVNPADEGLLRGIDGTQRLGDFRREEERLRRTVYGLLAAGLLELRSTAEAATERRGERAPAAARPAESSRSAVQERAAPETGTRDRRRDDPRHMELLELADQIRAASPYDVLGVTPAAGESEIREAYERLAGRAHPDHFSDASGAVRDLAEEVFGLVRNAFDALTDPRAQALADLENKKLERKAEERRRSERAFEAEVEFRKGNDALTARRYEVALGHFGKALELYPDEGDHHAHYGWALHLCHPGDPAMVGEALEHVKRGLKLASHREKPYLFMGRLHKAIGRAEVAEQMFARAVQVDPECLEALRELRLIQMRREKSKGLIGRLFRR